MRIVLNNELEETRPHPIPYYGDDTLEKRQGRFVSNFIRKFEARSPNKLFKVLNGPLLTETTGCQDGYLWLVSEAYSNHRKLVVTPHDLWYIVLTELASVIKANPEQFRPLFTTSPEKVDIVVNTSDVTQIDLGAVTAQLRQLVPSNIDLFIPKLSTLDAKSEYALYAAFADAVQNYYSYMTLACGIREIEVAGTEDDWAQLHWNLLEIKTLFNSVDFHSTDEYLVNVGSVLDRICHSFEVNMTEFWKNIYSHRNMGSGGEKRIDGWISNLYFDKPKDMKLENFKTTWSVVPYTNIDTGRNFRAVNGCFLSDKNDAGFVASGYDQFVIETFDKVSP